MFSYLYSFVLNLINVSGIFKLQTEIPPLISLRLIIEFSFVGVSSEQVNKRVLDLESRIGYQVTSIG